eukprot:1922102-Pleurochrysis_carterae.AAC.1
MKVDHLSPEIVHEGKGAGHEFLALNQAHLHGHSLKLASWALASSKQLHRRRRHPAVHSPVHSAAHSPVHSAAHSAVHSA